LSFSAVTVGAIIQVQGRMRMYGGGPMLHACLGLTQRGLAGENLSPWLSISVIIVLSATAWIVRSITEYYGQSLSEPSAQRRCRRALPSRRDCQLQCHVLRRLRDYWGGKEGPPKPSRLVDVSCAGHEVRQTWSSENIQRRPLGVAVHRRRRCRSRPRLACFGVSLSGWPELVDRQRPFPPTSHTYHTLHNPLQPPPPSPLCVRASSRLPQLRGGALPSIPTQRRVCREARPTGRPGLPRSCSVASGWWGVS
jgi:hypothetical protein